MIFHESWPKMISESHARLDDLRVQFARTIKSSKESS